MSSKTNEHFKMPFLKQSQWVKINENQWLELRRFILLGPKRCRLVKKSLPTILFICTLENWRLVHLKITHLKWEHHFPNLNFGSKISIFQVCWKNSLVKKNMFFFHPQHVQGAKRFAMRYLPCSRIPTLNRLILPLLQANILRGVCFRNLQGEKNWKLHVYPGSQADSENG